MKKKFLLPIFLFFLLSIVFFLSKNNLFLTENHRFEKFTSRLFASQITSNTLNLHYTLAYPEQFGIENTPICLGSFKQENQEKEFARLENYQKALEGFSFEKLSRTNQITYDILKLEFSTQLSGQNFWFLQEPLRPNLGIQSQLPVLLAEYTFRCGKDIKDYFSLLSSLPAYYREILDFEKQKSENGFFMSDSSADRVIAQCRAFMEDSSSNYLSSMFQDKIEHLKASDRITEKQALSYIKLHEKIMKTCVFPAYETLCQELEKLKGTGNNPGGLANFPGGTSYYHYLIQTETGDFRPVTEIETRLYQQLRQDYQALQTLLEENSQVIEDLHTLSAKNTHTPKEILRYLNQIIKKDFPSISVSDYKVKYVHSSMEEFSSPAFYLTPPADTLSPNTIYINKSTEISQAELFTTLAHEGFPGHLYQTLYYGNTNPPLIRNLLGCSGYVEGWATYAEFLSFRYGADYLGVSPDLMEFLRLNRCVNLCLYSLLDIGIHFHGWDQAIVSKTLHSFGILSQDTCGEIFQYIVENPGNYLKYYVGYLNFTDLRTKAEDASKRELNLKQFHQQILEIGPAPFPVLEKYVMNAWE